MVGEQRRRWKGERMAEARFPSPMTCPVAIGRAQELTTLRSLVERVAGGVGQVALISGEAGIGKSRLVAETKAYAAAHRFLILEGQCFQTDSAAPYAPLLDLFRAYFARLAHGPTLSPADPVPMFAAALSRLLPELALAIPALAVNPASPAVDPEEEKRQIFASISHFVAEQATQCPVLLVVEDVHWCDDLSLELLLRLARRCQQTPLLLLVTYRSEDVSSRLRGWLAQLDREHLAQEYLLRDLSRADVEMMLRAMLDGPQKIDADLLDTLYSRSEGNPFFVEELLKSLMTAGELVCVADVWKRISQRAPTPRSVQEAVQQRTMYLSADAKRLIMLAAVAGRRFNGALLQEILGCDDERFLSLLKEVVAAQLIIEETADQFAFRHALTQEAIVAELLLRERQGAHRSLAQALERLITTSPTARERYLEDLATHCYEAGLWEQALAYAQEAGKRALALYAHQVAIMRFTQAEEAAHRLTLTTPLPDLCLARGQAYETLGDFERARSDYERALDVARAEQDRVKEWQSMIAIGFLWTGHDYEQAGIWLRAALALAEQLDDPALRARSFNLLGNWLVNIGRIQEALDAHQMALTLYQTLAARRGVAETLEMLGMTLFFMGDTASAVRDYYGRAIEVYRSLGDRQGLSSVLAMRFLDVAAETIETTYSGLLPREECQRDAEEALRLARQTNSSSGQAFVEMAIAYTLTSFGDIGPAFAHAQEALRIGASIEHQEWIVGARGVMGLLYLLLLDPDTAASYLEAAVADAQAMGSAIHLKVLAPYLAQSYLLKRDFSRAAATLEVTMPRDKTPGNFFERQVSRIWGELALAQGDAAYALAVAEQLLASAPGAARPQPIPHLLALKGDALLALKRLDEAAEALEEAKLGAQQRQAPSILWRIHASLGRVYRLLRRMDDAQREYAVARSLIQQLATTIDDAPLRERFLHAAFRLLPAEKPTSARDGVRQAFGGLTPREREVAALIAQGKTSREIADLLVVSERTAETHVSNILSKLGFTARAQIAAWAVEHGLSRHA